MLNAPPPKFQSLNFQPKGSIKGNLAADECDTDSFYNSPRPPPQIPKRKPKFEDRETNVFMIKFGALSKPCKVHTGDPVVCSNDQCAAILNYHSKITKETEGEGNVRIYCAMFRLYP